MIYRGEEFVKRNGVVGGVVEGELIVVAEIERRAEACDVVRHHGKGADGKRHAEGGKVFQLFGNSPLFRKQQVNIQWREHQSEKQQCRTRADGEDCRKSRENKVRHAPCRFSGICGAV